MKCIKEEKREKILQCETTIDITKKVTSPFKLRIFCCYIEICMFIVGMNPKLFTSYFKAQCDRKVKRYIY